MAHEGKALEKKKKQVEELVKMLKGAKLIAIVDLRNLPDNILQSVKKKLRGRAEFSVYKNAIITRAIERAKAGEKLIDIANGKPNCVITSNEIEAYELYQFFEANKGKVAAKPGQTAPYDITVPAGDTDLPPGPALSELKAGGIDARVKSGKIVIGRDSTVAKEGEKITDAAAKALQKVNIFPFEAGVEMIGAEEGDLLFTPEVLSITVVEVSNGIKEASGQAFNVSINTSIPTTQNAEMLINQAYMQANFLGLNAEIYSEETIEALLSKAFGQAVNIKTKANIRDPGEDKPEAKEGTKEVESKAEGEEKPKEEKVEEPKKEEKKPREEEPAKKEEPKKEEKPVENDTQNEEKKE